MAVQAAAVSLLLERINKTRDEAYCMTGLGGARQTQELHMEIYPGCTYMSSVARVLEIILAAEF